MKRAWTKLWPCASALAISVLATQHSLVALAQARASAKRANELTLAGLRPGRDAVAAAERRFKGEEFRSPRDPGDNSAFWNNQCWGHQARVDFDEQKIIQTITVSLMGPQIGYCIGDPVHRGPLAIARMKTGRGLALNDPCKRIVELYGPPNSRGPSTKGNRELELLFYAFDWAGSDMPQVMEVSCDRASGRVIEITLAFPSL